MKTNRGLRGLYAITDRDLAAGQDLVDQVAAALQGGARLIQYRDKGGDRQRRHEQASRLLRLTRQQGALLIINDDVELAAATSADGVHLGKQDTHIAEARERLGPDAIIGISCYNRLELARQAQRTGADYLAFGRFFPSRTKPQAVQAEPQLLRRAKRELHLPLVAIGGITPENGASLITAGADMLAVIHAVFGQPDVRQACERFRPILSPEDNRP